MIHLFEPITNSRMSIDYNGIFMVISHVRKNADDLDHEVKNTLLHVKNGSIFYPNEWGEFVEHKYILDLTKLVRKDQVQEAVANYMRSEGCSCCQDRDAHIEHTAKLGVLLDASKYEDGSGYDFNA